MPSRTPTSGYRWPVSETTHDVTPVVRLLGDIAAQFRHLPIEQGAAGVATHIRQFWDPRMRAKLSQELAAPTGDDLIDAVLRALST
jgi:formate dehydrogenase subunit delta